MDFCISCSHAIFKLTYLSNHDYKHLYFESDAATVNEIVLKVWATQNGTRDTGGQARALWALWALSAIIVLAVAGTG
ncbi:hypothetical protein DV515_00013287 [Chloebia gouldiae]|uniref:Uncharacterized protein n=1 Tax=Chloebia gouldiae TaxID=44316 RepID=A0A3L8S1M8_CHLGU|nr:hypothetical protein DV515_00013287 [Chloebia gouldiae]